MGGLPFRDVLLVVLDARTRQPVVGEKRAHVALEPVVRHGPQAPRLVEASNRQVDLLRPQVLKGERRTALLAEAATRDLRGSKKTGSPASHLTDSPSAKKKAPKRLPNAFWHMRQWQ
jgi:hypothetical protein